MEPDLRDRIVDALIQIQQITGLSLGWLLLKAEIPRGRFYDWKARYGKLNEHNGMVPRDHWLTAEEEDSIVKWYQDHPFDGYRRCCYMMMDADVVAASPSTIYRVLSRAGLLSNRTPKPSKKGTGFVQPFKPHDDWHIDIAYVNCAGTFYYLCSVLDGYSRMILHHELKEQMKESDVELILGSSRKCVSHSRFRTPNRHSAQAISQHNSASRRPCGHLYVILLALHSGLR